MSAIDARRMIAEPSSRLENEASSRKAWIDALYHVHMLGQQPAVSEDMVTYVVTHAAACHLALLMSDSLPGPGALVEYHEERDVQHDYLYYAWNTLRSYDVHQRLDELANAPLRITYDLFADHEAELQQLQQEAEEQRLLMNTMVDHLFSAMYFFARLTGQDMDSLQCHDLLLLYPNDHNDHAELSID